MPAKISSTAKLGIVRNKLTSHPEYSGTGLLLKDVTNMDRNLLPQKWCWAAAGSATSWGKRLRCAEVE